MSEDWDAAAQDIAEGIAEVGMICALKRVVGAGETPWDTATGTIEYHEIIALQANRKIRDGAGTLIGTKIGRAHV